MRGTLLLLLLAAGCCSPPPALRPAPASYQVEYVRDGDTLYLQADGLVACVRLAVIDCPELDTPAGIAARDYVRGLLPLGSTVTAKRLGRDHYGRNLCLIYLPDGRELTALLLEGGYARRIR